MFRRRPFRPVRRAMIRPQLVALEMVSRANNLMASGKPAEAAQVFAQLAQEAERRGRAKPAANLRAQAAHAFALAKNQAAALQHARAALTQFAQLNMPQRAASFFANITQRMRENGMALAADTLQKEFGDTLKSVAPQATAPAGRLPSKCPHCAGPARSDEVEWIDAYSAECVYCGGVIQIEE